MFYKIALYIQLVQIYLCVKIGRSMQHNQHLSHRLRDTRVQAMTPKALGDTLLVQQIDG